MTKEPVAIDCDDWERESLFHITGRDEGTKTSSAGRENGSVVLQVETDDELLRLSAASLVAVQVISYQSTEPQALACGAVNPPSRVFATYQESESAIQATGIDGRAIAVEILPDDYDVR